MTHSKKKSLDFQPYTIFSREFSRINEFEELSDCAYGVTLQLMFCTPREELANIQLPEFIHDQMSFSMADHVVEGIEVSCEWITLDEYALRSGESLNEVKNKVSNKLLGHVLRNPDSNEEIVIWPQDYKNRPLDQLPIPGKKLFKVKVSITADHPLELELDNPKKFDKVQNILLKHAHSIGNSDEVIDRSREVLFRACFLFHWTLFEDFIRKTIHEMFKKHPKKIASQKSSAKPILSYEDIRHLSNNFSSIDDLSEALVERQILQTESESKSVNSLIYFLRTTFNFKEDPFKAWYVLKGQRHETDHDSLIEIKEVRNALIHNGGSVTPDFLSRFPKVPHRDNMIIIDEAYNQKCSLIIKSIAFRITDLIVRDKYLI